MRLPMTDTSFLTPRFRRYRTTSVTTLAAAALLALPLVANAQDVQSDTRTHVVKEGDTLWDIARMYLGDPFLWPEIYRLNTEVVEDPHWIYPGEVLRIGGAAGPIMSEGPVEQGGATIFGRRTVAPQRVVGRRSLIGREAHAAVRLGEYHAAPFVEREGGPGGAGSIIETSEIPGIQRVTRRTRLQLNERVFVRPPASVTPSVGDKYLVYKLGPELDGVGQVVVPTGIVTVETPRTGELTTVRIISQFEEMRLGEKLIPLDTFFLPATARPSSVELGINAKVIWLQDKPVLPSLQRYLVLDAAAKDGVRLGDQFTILKRSHEDDRGERIPEIPIAVAQVVRVTPYGTTAIIIGHEQPAVKKGAAARVTAKMP